MKKETKSYMTVKINPNIKLGEGYKTLYVFPIVANPEDKVLSNDLFIGFIEAFIDSPNSNIPKFDLSLASGVIMEGYVISVDQDFPKVEIGMEVFEQPEIDLGNLTHLVHNNFPKAYRLLHEIVNPMYQKKKKKEWNPNRE